MSESSALTPRGAPEPTDSELNCSPGSTDRPPQSNNRLDRHRAELNRTAARTWSGLSSSHSKKPLKLLGGAENRAHL